MTVRLALLLGFAATFLLLYGGCSWLTGWVPYRFAPLLPGERGIPFVPQWAAVYLSLNVLLLVSVLRPRLGALLLTLVAQTAIACVFFLVLPLQRLEPVGAGGLFAYADALNLENNYFPSLHVSYALTVAALYSRGSGRGLQWAWWTWAAGIAASTLLLRQHYVVDVLGAALLAAVSLRWIYPRCHVEVTCLREFARCVRRHARYLIIALALYAVPWRGVLRYGFCFLQHVDDLLDGHLAWPGEPLDRVDDLRRQLQSNRFEPGPIGELARHFWTRMAPEGRTDALALIEEMRLDRLRVRDRLLWDREQLREHLRRTFELSLNLLFVATRAELRATDVPELVEVLGWCSTFRDLEDDLALGLVNVPRDVVDAAGEQPLRHSAAFRAWEAAEWERAQALLLQCGERLESLRGRSGQRVATRFWRSVVVFAKRYSKARTMTRQVGQS